MDLFLSLFRIPAHRHILYAANHYFKTMFTMGLKESSQSEISIQDVDGEILQQLITHCYTGQIAVAAENVDEMTIAANMLQFKEVREQCAAFYPSILCVSNCLGIREIAALHNMARLQEEAHHFVLDHFVDVSKSDEFLQLSNEQLSELLVDDEINVTEEEEVFRALMRWVKYDVNGRTKYFESALKGIRFQHVKETVSN